MALYTKGGKVQPYHGDHHPLSIYEGASDGTATTLYAPATADLSGTSVFEQATYNDRAEVTVYGRSTQDGTPTPDAPVEIVSITEPHVCSSTTNLWSFGDFSTVDGEYKNWVARGTEFSLAAGTYTITCDSFVANDSAPMFGFYDDGTRIELFRFINNQKKLALGGTFTISKPLVSVWFVANQGGTISGIRLNQGDADLGYSEHRGTYRDLTSLLAGRSLRSLPDGTRDEVRVGMDGSVVLVQRVGSVDLGTLSWSLISWASVSSVFATDGIKSTGKGANWSSEKMNGMCTFYEKAAGASIASGNDNHFGCDANCRVYINDSSYADASSFKAAMSGVTLIYELATPVTTALGTIDPLPTYHGGTTLWEANGADITAHVRVVE